MLKKFGLLLKVLLGSGLIWLAAFAHIKIWPAFEAVVKLPMGDATARFQTWSGVVSRVPFVLRVDTPRGSLSTELWSDWGPAPGINLYQTPENWLVGIGGGGISVMIDVMNASGPKLLTERDEIKVNDAKWKYLGYAAGDRFIYDDMMPECIALYGEGETPYRKNYQDRNDCSYPVKNH